MSEAAKIFLSYWKQKETEKATFKALLEILIDINKESVAQCVRKYVKARQPSEEYSPTTELVQTRQYNPTSRAFLALEAVGILLLVLSLFAINILFIQRPQTITLQSKGPDLIMTDFAQHKRKGDIWYSPSVHTHHEGYKICLGVFANGEQSGKGTYIKVAVYFMRGEFDDSLEWPFRGIIHFQLVDQLNGVRHREHMVSLDDSVPDKYRSRVMKSERAEWGWGIDQFIAQNQLEPRYLQNDCLIFKVELLFLGFNHGVVSTLDDSVMDQFFQTPQKKQDERIFNYHPPSQIEIVNSYSLTVFQDGYSFNWEGNGLKIYFPKNSVKSQTTCVVSIYSSLSGEYNFPSNHRLVSAVYWIEPSPSCKFKKPITIQIQHCAAKEHRNRLSFVRANSDTPPPYKFQDHDNGIFSDCSVYGTLTVTQFSAWAVTYKGSSSTEDPVKRFYSARLFYMGTSLQSWIIYLAITWDTDVHNKVRKLNT